MPAYIGQFEAHRSPSLLLADGRPVHRVTTRGDVIPANGDNVAAAQLAVDGKIEKGEISLLAFDLQLGPNRPDVARPQRWLRADKLALVPGHASPFDD